MRRTPDGLILSATDVSNSLACRHLTGLDLSAANGERGRPFRPDPLADILRERGIAHEAAYVDWLRSRGREVADLRDTPDRAGATLAAMAAGCDVIVQGELRFGRWIGLPDVLVKVARTGSWRWSYEAVDTKLARETRGGTILQLGVYSELLRHAQGAEPEFFHVVTPKSGPGGEVYRASEYAAYVRLVRDHLEGTVRREADAVMASTYPEPADHCDVCAWFRHCDARRREDDHLSLVAGATRSQRRELVENGIGTLTALAACGEFPFALKRTARLSLGRTRDQAKVQFASRALEIPRHELRPRVDKQGFCRLPEPSPGDVFLDLEGDPFAVEGGREYLFGLVAPDAVGAPTYRSWWASTHAEEAAAFREVMDFIASRRAAHPAMHVYHYAHYEPTAFLKLAGRHATRGEALDQLLRADVFVDLYSAVRQSLLAGVERYSIKNLEPLYGFERTVSLETARFGLRNAERCLETGGLDVPQDVRDVVIGYNRDDCVSTLRLRDWLESQRSEEIAKGTEIPRPTPEDAKASEKVTERIRRVDELRALLLRDIPADKASRTEEQQTRWLLAYMLDWHRREDKAAWWEYFRLRELPEDELYDERQAVAGLEFKERRDHPTATGGRSRTLLDRYSYPFQEMEIRIGNVVKTSDGKEFGRVAALDRGALTIDIAKRAAHASHHPSSVFSHTVIGADAMEKSIDRISVAVLAGDASRFRAARRLLAATPPSLGTSAFEPREGESTVDFAIRAVGGLDPGVLAIQGPPGAGKTYAGARMIRALVASGKKVGVTASSHKVVLNLMEAVLEDWSEPVAIGHRGDEDDLEHAPRGVVGFDENDSALRALKSGAVRILGGTAWLWSREEFADAVDVLFVDEAGQMSLANVVASSQAARSVVLLGDPQQLEQPIKGSHPEGVDASALGHMLGDHLTIPPDRGIFLPTTWRLAPAIASFTSELFYEGRLAAKPGLEHQALVDANTPGLEGAGLWFHPVDHEGNRSSSEEEIAAIEKLVARLLAGVHWVDEEKKRRPLEGKDILVVAPYNAQVSRLAERLAATGARVGTVDKFQGQEAPIVIYSMATSRPEDAPRGMEFLYSLNRLNVATSRARCAAILVASPRLFEPECRTPRQMKLANALCRFRELARLL